LAGGENGSLGWTSSSHAAVRSVDLFVLRFPITPAKHFMIVEFVRTIGLNVDDLCSVIRLLLISTNTPFGVPAPALKFGNAELGRWCK
jgi:hypothetical protein